ncbi:hypothetical protein SAMN05216386_1015 [Nitrosospira briensis]|uniref:Uncharacterized protein n=1 Tax=Nitrosospira briensis TaxID=35799 RepID=A0A1I4Z3U8_9PROT|nr:hypothetical protein SAMN05216386_1015 [Nitrosospira briensis]
MAEKLQCRCKQDGGTEKVTYVHEILFDFVMPRYSLKQKEFI